MICNIPISARISVVDGVATVESAEYMQIPAELIAEFIMRKLENKVPWQEKEKEEEPVT